MPTPASASVPQYRTAQGFSDDRCRDLLMSVLEQTLDDYGPNPSREKFITPGLREHVAPAVRGWISDADAPGRITFAEVCEYVGLPLGATQRALLRLPGLRRGVES